MQETGLYALSQLCNTSTRDAGFGTYCRRAHKLFDSKSCSLTVSRHADPRTRDMFGPEVRPYLPSELRHWDTAFERRHALDQRNVFSGRRSRRQVLPSTCVTRQSSEYVLLLHAIMAELPRCPKVLSETNGIITCFAKFIHLHPEISDARYRFVREVSASPCKHLRATWLLRGCFQGSSYSFGPKSFIVDTSVTGCLFKLSHSCR